MQEKLVYVKGCNANFSANRTSQVGSISETQNIEKGPLFFLKKMFITTKCFSGHVECSFDKPAKKVRKFFSPKIIKHLYIF